MPLTTLSGNSLNYPQAFTLPPFSAEITENQTLVQRLKALQDQWNNHFQIASNKSQNSLCDATYHWLAHICTSHQIQVYPRDIGETLLTSTLETIIIPKPSDEETVVIPCRIKCQNCQNIYQEIDKITQDQQVVALKSEILKALDTHILTLINPSSIPPVILHHDRNTHTGARHSNGRQSHNKQSDSRAPGTTTNGGTSRTVNDTTLESTTTAPISRESPE